MALTCNSPATEEHKSTEILAVNPRGQVPTFIDNGVVVCESGAAVQVRTADGMVTLRDTGNPWW